VVIAPKHLSHLRPRDADANLQIGKETSRKKRKRKRKRKRERSLVKEGFYVLSAKGRRRFMKEFEKGC
jgi:hypothetical protein